MAKIWRRTKGKKQIGSYIVLVRGKRVNLGTDDAEKARDRAKLALSGKWPEKKKRARSPEEEDAAAKVAAAALHVEADPEPEPIPEIPAQPAAPTPGENETPPAAPSPEDEAAAVAAAVDAGAGEPEPDDAIDPEEAAKRAEWRTKMEAIFGGSMGGGTVGKAIASGTVFGEGLLFAYMGKRAKPRRYLVFNAQKVDFLIEGLGLAWDEQLRRWGIGLGEMEPWKAILACTAGITGAMAFSLTVKKPEDWPEEEGVDPSAKADEPLSTANVHPIHGE